MYGMLAFTGVSVLAYGGVAVGALVAGRYAQIKAKRLKARQEQQ